MSKDLALDVRDLVVEYGSVRAVDGVTFSARRGAVTAIIGPNGAGKTSSIEACEGYQRSYSGSIQVLGLDPVRDHLSLTKRMGVMLQGGGVYPSARVGETIRHYCALYDDVVSPESLIEKTGLRGLERRTWRALSGGEKQRLSLALALTGRPEIVFLDEPTAGVDIDGRAAIRRLVRELAEGGCSVIMATHELDEAERCADDVVVFSQGKVVHQSSLRDLLGADQSIRFATSSPINEEVLGNHLGITIRRGDDGYLLHGSSDTALISRIDEWLKSNGVSLRSVVAGGRRLEDAVQELREGRDQ
jgi:ABC-2 type transport system ATP-binding protein